MSTASTVTGNTSKAIERHLSSSYQVVLYVAKNLDKITDLTNLMKYFDNFYTGAYTTPPSTTPSGEVLTAGMFYLNLVDDHLYFWAQLDGVYAWYKMDTIATNVIAQFDAHAAGVTASFTQLAESYKVTFLTYLGDTQTYRNQTEVMYQQVVLMHAAVINAYDQVLPVLEHIEAIEAVSSSITKVITVADNIGSVNAVANNMPAVINAGTYVNQIANAVASTHADALATAADRTVTESNVVSTAADKVAVTAMRNEVEVDRVEVANNTVTVAGQAAQVAADTVSTQTNRNEAVAANALAKQWATGNTPVGDTPSDVNNARYYSEVAKANANQTFKSGGLFTPTAGQEYPDVTGVSVDTVWLIEFPTAADSYLYGSGSLAGQTVRNGYQLYYDTPANTFGVIATTLSGVQKVNGKNPNALGEITLTAEDLSDVYSKVEVDAHLVQKAQDSAVVKLAGNQTIDGTKTFTAAVKGVKAVADEDLPTKAQMDVLASAMSQAQFEAIRAQNNEQFAASGFVHFGKHVESAKVNNGLWVDQQVASANKMYLGRGIELISGNSKTNFPLLNIAGVTTSVDSITTALGWQVDIKFPQAEKGTRVYDSATGISVDYAKEVDPKYGDIAATPNEAVSRAFEGLVKNGDFRNGATDWVTTNGGISNFVVENGYVSWETNGDSGTGVLESINLPAGSYIVSFVAWATSNITAHSLLNTIRPPVNLTTTPTTFSYVIDANAGTSIFEFLYTGANVTTKRFLSNVSIRKASQEVVTDRVDMWGFEAWLEEVSTTNPYIYPNGLIQSQATTMEGIDTSASARPETYYAVFDGDTGSKGKGVNFFALTDAQKKKVLGNHKNNLYYLDDGRLVQWRLRQRSIAGAGNGDWLNVEGNLTPFNGFKDYLAYAGNDFNTVAPQGASNVGSDFTASLNAYTKGARAVTKSQGIFSQGVSNVIVPVSAVNSECYFLVGGTVKRLNQGAYHPSFNPSGTDLVSDNAGNLTAGRLWHESRGLIITSVSDAFSKAGSLSGSRWGTIGSTISGRPDGRFHDAIYANGQGGVCRDMRYSAYGITSEDFAEADPRVKNSTYRGFERQVFSRVEPNTPVWLNAETLQFDIAGNGTGPYVMGSIPLGTKVHFISGDGAVASGVVTSITNGTVVNVSTFTGFAQGYNSVFLIVENPTKYPSVGGAFLQTDVFGNPANILANPALANGWQGSWGGLPVSGGVSKSGTRKMIASGGITYSSDNGATWGTGQLPQPNAENVVTSTYGETEIRICQYQAFAKQTENAVNAEVYGKESGIGSVMASSSSSPDYGVFLGESLCGVINKNDDIAQAGMFTVNSINIDQFGKISSKAWNTANSHAPLTLGAPVNNSPAFKALNYNVNLNQQAFIQYAYTELKHNGTNWGDDGKVTIVDNQATKTDLNGNTVLVGTAKLKEPIGWIKNTF